MVFQQQDYGAGVDFNQELMYDLRQRYAKVIGDIIEFDLSMAIRDKNYSEWFRSLENIYSFAYFKIKKLEKKDTKNFNHYKEGCIKVANLYSDAWNKNSSDAKEVGEIEGALRKMLEYLFIRMDEAKMFGAKRQEHL